ncbi:MAG TPA: hypothetical protein ENJ75_01905 [Candidatus Kaiserbacteria bacterium]|nr:hypothetical protein [Candidatus Kaiserbacteria bacterium]
MEENRKTEKENGMDGDFLFITEIGCMDGRETEPVERFIKNTVVSEGESREIAIDKVTEPGMDAILSGDSNFTQIFQVYKKSEISAKHHKSSTAIVVGHSSCAGNPVEDSVHIKQIEKSVKVVSGWNLFTKIIGVFVDAKREVQIISSIGEGKA